MQSRAVDQTDAFRSEYTLEETHRSRKPKKEFSNKQTKRDGPETGRGKTEAETNTS